MLVKIIRIGVAGLFLTITAACSSNPIKTETVKVYVPRYIQLPADLTAEVPVPEVAIEDNGDLAEYALKVRAALDQANRQLEAIRGIEP
jgi:hypothetical protein